MRIAIAGGGALAKYFADEFPKAGLEVVILTRAAKPFFTDKHGVIAQRTTDYSSIEQLTELLADCDALVSTIQDYTPQFISINLNLVAACKKSPKCKRFIPAEFGGDVDKYPDQPAYYEPLNGPIRQELHASSSELEWTIVCVGGFMELYLPKRNHYFGYIPDVYDAKTNTTTIVGTGDELVSLTSARDAARATAQLLLAPSGSWRPHVYMQGDKTTQQHIATLLQGLVGDSNTQIIKHSLTQLIQVVAAGDTTPVEAMVEAQIGICTLSGAVTFDETKVARDHAQYFPELPFETVDDVFARRSRMESHHVYKRKDKYSENDF